MSHPRFKLSALELCCHLYVSVSMANSHSILFPSPSMASVPMTSASMDSARSADVSVITVGEEKHVKRP